MLDQHLHRLVQGYSKRYLMSNFVLACRETTVVYKATCISLCFVFRLALSSVNLLDLVFICLVTKLKTFVVGEGDAHRMY